jgi:hypothetical protein
MERTICLHAAETIFQILEVAQHQELLSKSGPLFAYCLWVASRMYLAYSLHLKSAGPSSLGNSRSLPPSPSQYAVPRPSEESLIDNQLHSLLLGLQTMGDFWPIASRYAQLLSRLLEDSRFRNVDSLQWTKVIADMSRSERDVEAICTRPETTTLSHSSTGRSRTKSHCESLMESVGSDPFNLRLPNGFDKILDR